MRVLGLDVGSRRIGLAISDETGTIAQPLKFIAVKSSYDEAISEIKKLCEEYSVQAIVVGLPLSLSGGDQGASAAAAKHVGDLLAKRLGISVEYWDERFTTTEAERLLVNARVRRADRRAAVDKVAAALILQGYLDAKSYQEEDAY
ncbi:MAG: Holliday junction resolvase RuvX [Deltaproteobacteria bacterium]|nr:Holliday junction resolvase RuvX [Deltaproteobacteria bacterium]